MNAIREILIAAAGFLVGFSLLVLVANAALMFGEWFRAL